MRRETCDEAVASLWQLADGELDPAKRRDLERHLDGCAPCRGALASILATDERLANALPAAPRPELASRVADDVLRRAAISRGPQAAALLPAAAFLAVAAAAAFALLLRPPLDPAALVGRLPAVTAALSLPSWSAPFVLPDLAPAGDVLHAAAERLSHDAAAWAAVLPRSGAVTATSIAALLLVQLLGTARLLAPRRRAA